MVLPTLEKMGEEVLWMQKDNTGQAILASWNDRALKVADDRILSCEVMLRDAVWKGRGLQEVKDLLISPPKSMKRRF